MLIRAFLLLALSGALATAADNVPSEASIRELLAITQAQKMLDGMMPQMQAMMQASVREATKGQPVPPDAQKMIDRSIADAQKALQEELSWARLEPLYIRIYQRSLTQEEVNGMIDFYKSPTGQAMIIKMPVIMQNTMAELQAMMAPMMQRMQRSQQELVTRMQAEKNSQKSK